MNEPAPAVTQAQAPAPSPAATSLIPPVADAAPAAGARPEWLPEAHWDPTASTIKPEFGQHYAEVSTFYQTETEKRAALAARKPEDIKIEIKLPETVKVPDGMEIKIDESDPRVPIIREMAIKNGWDQDQINELVALDAQQKIAAHAAEQARVAAETAKLGDNAKDRIAAATNWAKGLRDKGDLTADEFEEIRMTATTAAGVSALEKLIAKSNGAVPGTGGHMPAPGHAPKTVEERWYGQKG
jgi:hypothetical protein